MLSADVFNVVQTALHNITETQKETEECKKNQRGTENRTYIFVKGLRRFPDLNSELRMRDTGWGRRGRKQSAGKNARHRMPTYTSNLASWNRPALSVLAVQVD